MINSGNLKEKIKFFVMKEPSIMEFFERANLNIGRYKCIGDILAQYRNEQKLNLTPKEQNMLNNKRSGRGKDIGEKLSTTEMFKIFGKDCLEMDLSDSNKKKLKLHRHLESCRKYSISYSCITDEEIRLSISGFVDLVYETNDGDQIDYIDKLIEIIEKEGHVNETTMDDKFNHDKLPRYIAKHFFNLTDENFWREIANSVTRNGDQISFPEVQQMINDSNTDYADIVKIIGMMLIEQKHLHEEERQNYKSMAGFLTVSRHLRNCKDHVGKGMSKEKSRLIVACFLLYTLIGLYLMLTKNLKDWGRIDLKRDKSDDIKTLCVYYGYSDNYPDVEVPIKLVKIDPKGKEYVEPELSRRGCKEYTIFKWCKYQIEIGGTFDVPDDKLWGTLSDYPVVMWSGVKPHFFGSIWAVSGEFRHYVETDIQGTITDNTGAIKDNTKKVSKCQESISELSEILKILTRIIGSDDESVEKPQTLIGSLKDLRDLIKVSQDNLTDIVAKLLEVIENEKKQKRKRKFERTRWLIDILVVFVCLSWLLYNIFDVTHNLTYLNHFWLYLLLFVGPIVAGLFLWKTHVAYSDYSNKILRIIDAGMVALSLIFVIGAFLPNKGPESFFATYDFAATHAAGDNIKVAQLMEDYLATNPTNDENVRTQLGRYYLTYVNDKERAYEIIRPMIDNPDKYRNGSITIADLLYKLGKYGDLRTILKKFENHPDPVIDRIKGSLLIFNNRGSDQNVWKGDSLLHQAAEKGDVEACYWLGYIYSNDMSKYGKKQDNRGTKRYLVPFPYDLFNAISFYRDAVNSNHPKSAIELGNIFSDLNMTDSAQYYYQKAIALAEGDLWKEANYRMGLLCEKQGSTSNKFMEAVELTYGPAILHKAIKENDHSGAIQYYKDLGGYLRTEEKARYIHPIVFHYIARNDEIQHDMECALDTLRSTRPKAMFNMAFLKGLQCFMSSDSITINRGLDYMKESSETGCLYAKMLCIYENLRSAVREQYEQQDKFLWDNISKGAEELEEIGKEIPFAYVLLSLSAREMGSLKFKISDIYANEAINRGCSAGVLLLSYVPESVFFKEIGNIVDAKKLITNPFNLVFNDSIIDNSHVAWLHQRCSNLQMGLRILLPNTTWKDQSVYFGLLADIVRFGLVTKKKQQYAADRLHLWADIAMANHAFGSECQMLSFIKNNNDIDIELRHKLIRAALKDNYHHEEDLNTDIVEGVCNFLADILKGMSSDFVASLRDEFKGNILATAVLEKVNTPINEYYIPVPSISPFYFDVLNRLDHYGLATEYSDITNGNIKYLMGKRKFKNE